MLSKDQVIAEAKEYIEKHGYVNLQWFIKEKLNLKVQNSFIKSVASLIVQDKRYTRDKLRIEKNPDYLPLNLELESSIRRKANSAANTAITYKIIVGVIIGLLVLLIGRYIFGIG